MKQKSSKIKSFTDLHVWREGYKNDKRVDQKI